MSTDTQATAIKALIAAATKYPCYDQDEAQKGAASLPATYSIIYLGRRFGGNVRGGTQETDLRRLQTLAVSSSVQNARLVEDRIAALFAHASHDVAGSRVHFAYEGGGGLFDFDDVLKRYRALTDWTFTL